MNEYIYIRVQVGAAKPEQVALVNSLAEQVCDQLIPDVIPHTSPGAIKFQHARLVAESMNDAYLKGWELLPTKDAGTVCNDYVVLV